MMYSPSAWGSLERCGLWYDMCMSLTERTQVLLSPEQRRKVAQLAARSSTSLGAVIRAAIDSYVPSVSSDRRRRALEELFALDAPVADWDEMEREIEAGYTT